MKQSLTCDTQNIRAKTRQETVHAARPPTVNTLEKPTDSSQKWERVYMCVKAVLAKLVSSAYLIEPDQVIADLAQETVLKTFVREQQGIHGEASLINSLEALGVTIARNLFIDYIRRNRRIVYISPLHAEPTPHSKNLELQDVVDIAEVVHEMIYDKALVELLAVEITRLSPKQKRAVLVDLSKYTSKDTPVSLQKALLAVGIRLEDFAHCLPTDPVERKRHNASLHLGYKALRLAPVVQEYIAA